VAESLRFSRWRRLPGVHRITEKRIPTHRAEAHRLTLYLPGAILDQAEGLAARAGASDVQSYCESLLRQAIEAEAARQSVEAIAVEIPSDLDELVRECLGAQADGPERTGDVHEVGLDRAPRALAMERPTDSDVDLDAHATLVIGHAALDKNADPCGFLARLRRGEAVTPHIADELLRALVALEQALRGVPSLDRRLAFALHRLAFEGQVLLTDAWPALAADQATVDVLRLVQEAVERILSGENIRYRTPADGPEPLP
jgi:hypothetical protein